MDRPTPSAERPEVAETPAPTIDQDHRRSAIPLLSEVVVAGAAQAVAAETAAADARATVADDTHCVERQLLERLVPKVEALVEVSVRQALSEASQQIVRDILVQLHQQISTMPKTVTPTPMQQTPKDS
jgi:hypothetical protein